MLRLVIFLIVACVLAWGAVWIAEHPGSVTIKWFDYEAILSMGAVLTMALLAAVGIVVLFEILRWLFSMPRKLRLSRAGRRELRGQQALTRGLMAAAAGDLNGARQQAREVQRYLPEHAGLLFLTAQTAQLEGREEVAHLKFRQMLERRDGEFVGLRGLLAQAMKAGDFDEALELAKRAYRRSPTTPWVLSTLYDLLTRAERWEEALQLVGEMQAQRLLDEPQARHKRAVLHHLLASHLRRADRIGDALAQAQKAAKAEPGFAPAAVQAAELAWQQGRRRPALQILEDSWRAEPHPDVARAYLELDSTEAPAQRLQRINQRLAPLNREHPETLILQGEAAMQAQQWDEARRSLEAAVQSGHGTKVYRLLAELERQSTGDNAKAQEWLARAPDAAPDKAWVCEDTSEVLPAWQPFGPSGRFDAVRWTTPPRIATLLGVEHASYILPSENAETAPAETEHPAAPATASPTVPAAVAS